MSTPTALVQKLWNYCNPAKRDDDGLSFRLRKATARQDGDYVEQLIPLEAGLVGSLSPARSGLRPFASQKPFRTVGFIASAQSAPRPLPQANPFRHFPNASNPGGSSLKMADEQSRPPFNPPSRTGSGGTGKPSAVPKYYAWLSLDCKACKT